ncbi:MAG TPA: hypothetical protein EYN67_03120 [Flavobacteriales bacterium]|nr:hypothetical protein [Flavobacteriales bacterium]
MLIWSTSDTTSTITVSLMEMATYTLAQTLNGESCYDEVTMLDTGCVDINDLMDVLASYGTCQIP